MSIALPFPPNPFVPVQHITQLARDMAKAKNGSGGGKKEKDSLSLVVPFIPDSPSPYTPDTTVCKASKREFPADWVRRDARTH